MLVEYITKCLWII